MPVSLASVRTRGGAADAMASFPASSALPGCLAPCVQLENFLCVRGDLAGRGGEERVPLVQVQVTVNVRLDVRQRVRTERETHRRQTRRCTTRNFQHTSLQAIAAVAAKKTTLHLARVGHCATRANPHASWPRQHSKTAVHPCPCLPGGCHRLGKLSGL